MSAFLFALVAVALASIGGRDQRLIAQLAAQLGTSTGLLVTGLATSMLTAGLMAWAGSTVAAMLPAAAKAMLVAIALLFAAVELAWAKRMRAAQEPTRSLGAIALVLAAYQITDGARFLIFALAAAFPAPVLAGAGGALGGCIALAGAWLEGADFARWPLALIRRLLAAALLLAAMVIGLSARGLL